MSVIAAVVDSPAAVAALRRTLPPEGPRVVTCRTIGALERLFAREVVEVVVLSPRHQLWAAARVLVSDSYPAVNMVGYAAFRPADAELLVRCQREGLASAAVLGVDDPVVGDLVLRASLAARRRGALAHAPRMLGLVEQLQRRVWDYLVGSTPGPHRTEELAQRFGVTREHLSREFAAGGAPNLKRVVDLIRVVSASQLLPNPGYDQAAVARLLGFSSASHLSRTARRVAGVSASELATLEPGVILTRFVQGKTRSRL